MLTKTLFTPVLFGATAFPAALAARNGPRNSGLTVVDRNNEHLQPLDARELSRNPASPLTPQTAELRPVDGFQHESPVESPSASQLDSQSTATDLARDSKDSPQNADQRPGYTRTHSRSFPKMSKRSPEPRGHHRSNTHRVVSAVAKAAPAAAAPAQQQAAPAGAPPPPHKESAAAKAGSILGKVAQIGMKIFGFL